jgi:branched-chain amino acid transport system substrate-binding protein
MKVKQTLMDMRYSGIWNIKFDRTGEQVFSFNIVRITKGGNIDVQSFDPTK